jgi:diguanylate cyclase (GGDEF)-like protein
MVSPLLEAAHAFFDAPDQDSLLNVICSRTATVLGVPDAQLVRSTDGRDQVFEDLALQLGLDQPDGPADSDGLEVFYALEGAAFADDNRHALAQGVQRLFPDRPAVVAPVRAGSHFIGLLAAIEQPGQRTFGLPDAAVLAELAMFAGQALRGEEIARDREARDGLTGLFDQSYLRRELRVEISRSHEREQPLSLMLFDIDFFKRVNDTAGHPAGDAVLRQVAAFLSEQSRRADLAVRYGGEEFALLMPGTTIEAATMVAERLREMIAAVPAGDWRPWPDTITISCGVAELSDVIVAVPQKAPADDISPSQSLHLQAQEFISAVDQALYASKRGGRNRTTRADQMSVSAS